LHQLTPQIATSLLAGSLPYMSLERRLPLLVGVLSVLFGLFVDLFIPPPPRVVRVGMVILGIVAVCIVVWQQWNLV